MFNAGNAQMLLGLSGENSIIECFAAVGTSRFEH